MDITYQPAFVLSNNGTIITSRFLEFRKLCSLFAEEISEGRDPSTQILTKLTKYPPIRDVPILNNMFDLLKDSVFAYHMASVKAKLDIGDKLKVKVQQSGDSVGQIPAMTSDVSGLKKRYATFLPKETLFVCKKLFWELKQTCYDHHHALARLRDAVKSYQELRRKYFEAYRTVRTSTDEFYACTFNEERWVPLAADSLHAHKKCVQDTKEYNKCKEKIKLAFEKLRPLFENEKMIREEKLDKLNEELRSMIETGIRETLLEGMEHLMKVSTAAGFPEDLTEMIGSFDCSTAASKLYKDLSLKYFHPVIDQFCPDQPLVDTSFASPYFAAMDKEEQRFRAYGCYLSVLETDSQGKRQEELYVWANSRLDETDKKSQLILKMDSKIKQKFCSADGKLAFGWTRKLSCGAKHYGFYPTSATRLVP